MAGISYRKWTDEEIATVRAMAAELRTRAQIGAAFSVHPKVIERLQKRIGIVGRPKRLGVPRHEWTAEQVAIAREMGAAQASRREIAARLGLTRKQVDRGLAKNGITGRPWGMSIPNLLAEITTEVHRLGAEGLTQQEIADRVGISKKAVGRRLKGRPSIRHRGGFTEAEDAVIRQMVGAGRSRSEIAAVMKRTAGSIIARARRLGLAKSKTPQPRPKFFLPPPEVLETTGEPPGCWMGNKLAGWNEILRYWRDNGGKGWPEIGAVNDMRRAEGRPPFKPMHGFLSPQSTRLAA